MLVRHNTKLLEQAIDLQVKRSAIPTLQAEAEAHDKMARATGFRRLATGGAVAMAALGIGLAVWLYNAPHEPGTIEVVKEEPKTFPKRTERVTPDEETVVTRDKKDAPAGPAQPRTRSLPPESSNEPEKEAVPAPPRPAPTQPSLPEKENATTIDFTKFARKQVEYKGSTWLLEAGHYFADENDREWKQAWCYTQRTSGQGIEVKVSVADRPSPTAEPLAPVSSVATLQSVGLSDSDALDLAMKCPWLDGKSYSAGDFRASPGRDTSTAPPSSPETLPAPPGPTASVREDGWDAFGYDFPGMPVRGVAYEECQANCEANSACQAITYNSKSRACFLKSDATVMVPSPEATAWVKPSVAGKVAYSHLVLKSNRGIMGSQLSAGKSSYEDCVLACARSDECAGFHHNRGNSYCTLFGSVIDVVKNVNFRAGSKSASMD